MHMKQCLVIGEAADFLILDEFALHCFDFLLIALPPLLDNSDHEQAAGIRSLIHCWLWIVRRAIRELLVPTT